MLRVRMGKLYGGTLASHSGLCFVLLFYPVQFITKRGSKTSGVFLKGRSLSTRRFGTLFFPYSHEKLLVQNTVTSILPILCILQTRCGLGATPLLLRLFLKHNTHVVALPCSCLAPGSSVAAPKPHHFIPPILDSANQDLHAL